MGRKSEIFEKLRTAPVSTVPEEVSKESNVVSQEPEKEPSRGEQIQTEFQKWQESNPDGGLNQFLYQKNIKQPKPVDPEHLKKAENLAAFSDASTLLAEGIGAAMGGNVNKRTEFATDNVSRERKRLNSIYNHDQSVYNQGLVSTIGKDAALKESRLNYYRKQLDELQKRKDTQDFQAGQTDKKIEANKELFGVKNSVAEKNRKETQAFQAKKQEDQQSFQAGENEKNRETTKLNKEKAAAPSRVVVQRYVAKGDRDGLLAYFLDHGQSKQDAIIEITKLIPRKKKL